MDRFAALKRVDTLIKEHQLTKTEVLRLFEEQIITQEVVHQPASLPEDNKIHFTDVVYHIGGGIILLGIWTLLGMSWSSLDPVSRLVVTLGLTFVTYGAGLALSQTKTGQRASASLFFVAIATLPFGLWTIVGLTGTPGYSAGMHALISLVCGISATGLFYFHRKTVFLLGAILYITSAIVSGTISIGEGSLVGEFHLIEYLFIVIGLSYGALAYYMSHAAKPRLVGFLYSFGLIYTLGATLSLGGWSQGNANILWMLLYPLLLAGSFYMSVLVRRTSLLVLATIFLIIYVLKISSIYFADSIGWPFALMLAGLLVIGATFLSTNLRKSYIK